MSGTQSTQSGTQAGWAEKLRESVELCHTAYRSLLPPKQAERWVPTHSGSEPGVEEKPPPERAPNLPPADVNRFVTLSKKDPRVKMGNDLEGLISGLKDVARMRLEDSNAEMMRKACFDLLYMGTTISRSLGHSGAAGEKRMHAFSARLEMRKTSENILPDPKSAFERLLARPTGSEFKPNTQAISGIAHALGTILSLSLFRYHPDESNINYNDTTPLLDLSPLYGSSEEETNTIRDTKHREFLLPDSFVEDRVEYLTPSVSALLILFNRHHNYIARRLNAIETHKWKDGNKAERIFECARTINCVLFKDIILQDFLKGVLGFSFMEIAKDDPKDTSNGKEGSGNESKLPEEALKEKELEKSKFPDLQFLMSFNKEASTSFSSVEAAQLYQFSMLMSTKDEEWLQTTFGEDVRDFEALRNRRADRAKNRSTFECPSTSGDTIKRTSPNLEGKDPKPEGSSTEPKSGEGQKGKDVEAKVEKPGICFKDAELARILVEAIKDLAGLQSPQNMSSKFEHQVVAQLKRSRTWSVCTLNDYRTYLGLKPYSRFDEWNPNPDVWRVAQDLYKDIANLELYVGLLAEKSMDRGFQLGCTQAYGLCKDIVCISLRASILERLTACRLPAYATTLGLQQISMASYIHHSYVYYIKYTALETNLTKWGFKFCQSFRSGSDHGSAFPALILRALPHSFPHNHVFAHFPLSRQREPTSLPRLKRYVVDWNNGLTPAPVVQSDWESITKLMSSDKYITPYSEDMKALTGDYGHMLGFNGKTLHDADRKMVVYSLMPDSRTFRIYTKFFGETTRRLMRERKREKDGACTVDLLHDVINPLCTQWVLETLCGESPGSLDPKVLEIYMQDFALLYAYVFKRHEAADAWAYRKQAEETSSKMTSAIKGRLHDLLNPQVNAKNMKPSLFKEILGDILRFRFFRGFVKKYIQQVLVELTVGRDLDRLSFTFLERLTKTDCTPGVGLLPGRPTANQTTKSSASSAPETDQLTEIGHLFDKISEKATLVKNKQPSGENTTKGIFATALNKLKFLTVSIPEEERMENLLEKLHQDFRLSRSSANVIGLCVMMSVNYAATCALVINFFLQQDTMDEEERKERERHRQDIIDIVQLQKPTRNEKLFQWISDVENDSCQPFGPFPPTVPLAYPQGQEPELPAKDAAQPPRIPKKLQDFLLMNYIREAQRLTSPLILERTAVDTKIPVFANFHALHQDAILFPDPKKVDPLRDIYLHHGTGPCIRAPSDSSNVSMTDRCCFHRDADPEQVKRCRSSPDSCDHPKTCQEPTPFEEAMKPCRYHKVGRGCSSQDAINSSQDCELHPQGKSCQRHGFRPWSIQGLGMHKCPGLSFCDNTMPELLKAVFRAKDVQFAMGSKGISEFSYDKHSSDQSSMSPKLYIDRAGDTHPYPPTMQIQFKKDTESDSLNSWVTPKTPYPRRVELVLFVLLILYWIWLPSLRAVSATTNLVPLFGLLLRLRPSASLVPLSKPCCDTNDQSSTLRNATCNNPITVFRHWDVNTIFPGPDNRPFPVEYTLERSNPHRLSLLDIDRRDMQLAVYVDGILLGKTSEFSLNHRYFCSPESPEGMGGCFSREFSQGQFVIPPGKHTVRIIWVGKEFLPGTTSLDWGDERSRRFMWQLENCA